MLKNIDPINMPGEFMSHLHTFFGSDAIKANTTESSTLRTGCTTASIPNELSTYCNMIGIPTLLLTSGKSNVSLEPALFSAYYEQSPHAEIPYPEIFKVRAGNYTASSQAGTISAARVQWVCENQPEDKEAAAFPQQTCKTHLQNLIYFPDCVDPTNISSIAYSGSQKWKRNSESINMCPAGMKRLPRLRFFIRYDLRELIPGGWDGSPPLALSSGNSYSAHGDFFFGWDVEASVNMLKAGSQKAFNYVNGSRGLGNSERPDCRAHDRDPGNHAKVRRMEKSFL